jgi:uncharacterized membrane protein (UPF0127 family)
MKLYVNNCETDITISLYHSYIKRLKGLMFRLKPLINEGISIQPCDSIHMFFMFQSIDVVMCDKNGKVVHIKENTKPNQLILPKKNAYTTYELALGSIKLHDIKLNDQLIVK